MELRLDTCQDIDDYVADTLLTRRRKHGLAYSKHSVSPCLIKDLYRFPHKTPCNFMAVERRRNHHHQIPDSAKAS